MLIWSHKILVTFSINLVNFLNDLRQLEVDLEIGGVINKKVRVSNVWKYLFAFDYTTMQMIFTLTSHFSVAVHIEINFSMNS